MEGSRCDQCRRGTYNLRESNIDGCTECFCSGVTKICSSSRLSREQIPMNIFEDIFTLTNGRGQVLNFDTPQPEISTNEFSTTINGERDVYWSLPPRFLGNQILSYGGELNYTIRNEGNGEFTPNQDVLLTGNGLTLFWTQKNLGAEVIKI